jgi:hypothetical protein
LASKQPNFVLRIRRGNRSARLRLVCSIGVLASLLLGCATGPRCHGPSRAVTPARAVPAPLVTLAGVPLDATAEQFEGDCRKLGGELHKQRFCRPPQGTVGLANEGAAQLFAVDVSFDNFGHAKRITAHYVVEDAVVEQHVRGLVDALSEVLGDARSGDLYWCGRTAGCNLSSYAEWMFEGGLVKLESQRDLQGLELVLTHSHDDLQEKVIYGLPTCG